MIKEIEQDAKQFADARRTLIQAEKRAVAEVRVVDEPVTVVVSQKGWVRARQGPRPRAGELRLQGRRRARTAPSNAARVDTLLAFGSNGRVYTVPVSQLPGARGDGQPVTTLIELEPGTQPGALLRRRAGAAGCCSAARAATAFWRRSENMMSRAARRQGLHQRCEGEREAAAAGVPPQAPATPGRLPARSTAGCSSFEIGELKLQANGGRGLMLIDLEPKDTLVGAAAYAEALQRRGIGRGGKERRTSCCAALGSTTTSAGARARDGASTCCRRRRASSPPTGVRASPPADGSDAQAQDRSTTMRDDDESAPAQKA